MRQNQKNNRMRNRPRKGGSGNGGNPTNNLNRSYESNGPDVKVRGTPHHIAEKYQQLARDATSAGDRVAAENYYQHAEHYSRIIAAAQAQQAEIMERRRIEDERRREQDDRRREQEDRWREEQERRRQERQPERQERQPERQERQPERQERPERQAERQPDRAFERHADGQAPDRPHQARANGERYEPRRGQRADQRGEQRGDQGDDGEPEDLYTLQTPRGAEARDPVRDQNRPDDRALGGAHEGATDGERREERPRRQRRSVEDRDAGEETVGHEASGPASELDEATPRPRRRRARKSAEAGAGDAQATDGQSIAHALPSAPDQAPPSDEGGEEGPAKPKRRRAPRRAAGAPELSAEDA